ncbi:MAG: cold shock domain-containing protein [Candidatus Rokubacteria bacterium]|nr:cold shock domain-containing protein [Candidatus Rokubacteria bacterium]
MTGICHHFDSRRGFGKVTGADRRQYFAHRDDLLDVLELTIGQRVEFTPLDTVRGPRAVDVHPCEAAPLIVQAMSKEAS